MDAERKIALIDLMESSGYPVLLEVIDELVKLEESKVLKYDLRDGNTNSLLITKCEADGARKLAYSIQKYLKTMRVAALKA